MPICIAGMHRSGTSMVADLLRQCGLYFGLDSHFIPATSDNPRGYVENERFVSLNDEILIRCGGSWGNPPAVPDQWDEEDTIHQKALDLVKDFASVAHWGWKDPRNSLTLPFWRSITPEMKVIVCIRHPVEVARSLSVSNSFTRYSLNMTLWNMYERIVNDPFARPSMNPPFRMKLRKLLNQIGIRSSERTRARFTFLLGLSLWAIYNRSILEATTPDQRIITHYERFFVDPLAELRRLLSFIDLECSEQALMECRKSIDRKLRHQQRGGLHKAEAEIPPSFLSLYQRLSHEAGYTDR